LGGIYGASVLELRLTRRLFDQGAMPAAVRKSYAE
jgi:hypothetical protein